MQPPSRADLVAQASEVLRVSLDRTHILDCVSRALVPAVADWCSVEREAPASERSGEQLLVVPLVARGRTHGALVLSTAASGRALGPDEQALAHTLASHLACALDNVRLAEENERISHEAQAALRARDDFLSIASHELRSPLASLSLHLQALHRVVRLGLPDAHNPERLAQRLGTAEGQVERLSRLLTELLDVTRIAARKLKLNVEEVDLAQLVRDVAARFEPDLARESIALTVDAPQPVVGRWDRSRLEQVVTNLLGNAVKYGGARPIEITVAAGEGTARLQVVDHGIGIAPQHQATLFERFERGGMERRAGGFGLGLWIVKQILDAHAGSIAVQSTLGEGSTFTVELPR